MQRLSAKEGSAYVETISKQFSGSTVTSLTV